VANKKKYHIALSWYFSDFFLKPEIWKQWNENLQKIKKKTGLSMVYEIMPNFINEKNLIRCFQDNLIPIVSLHSPPKYPRKRYVDTERTFLGMAKTMALPLIVHASSLRRIKEHQLEEFLAFINNFSLSKEEQEKMGVSHRPQDLPIKLVIENSAYKKYKDPLCDSIPHLANWVREFQHEWENIEFGMVLDVGHLEKSVRDIHDITAAFESAKDLIEVIHFHDYLPIKNQEDQRYKNIRRFMYIISVLAGQDYGFKEECHKLPGTGLLPLKEFIQYLDETEFDGTLTLEIIYEFIEKVGLLRFIKIINNGPSEEEINYLADIYTEAFQFIQKA